MNPEFKATLLALHAIHSHKDREPESPLPRKLTSVYVYCPKCGDTWTQAMMRPVDAPPAGAVYMVCPKCDGREP